MFQTHACEGDNLRLNCPKTSAISIYSGMDAISSMLTQFNLSSFLFQLLAHFGGLRAAQDPDKLCPEHMNKFNSLNERVDPDDQRINSTTRCSSVQAFRIVDSRCRDNRTCTIQASIVEFLAQPNLTLITEQEAKKFRQSTEIMIDLCSADVTYAEVMYKCKPSKLN